MADKDLLRSILDKLSNRGIGRRIASSKKFPVVSYLLTRISRVVLRHYRIKFFAGKWRSARVDFSNSPVIFSELVAKHGSDKEQSKSTSLHPWRHHTYGNVYELLFAHCRNNIFNVFECGIGSINSEINSNMGANGVPGGSLRIWRDYFPNSQIFGADIDPLALFEETRIKTFQLDQTDEKSIAKLWAKLGDIKFDLMIDDGLHLPEAGITMLKNSIHKLNVDGIYVIEDVSFRHFAAYKAALSELAVDYVLISSNRKIEESLDNNLLIVRTKSSSCP